MNFNFSAETADQIWRSLALEFQKSGAIQNSRAGMTRELLHVFFSISNPRERWISARRPPPNPAFALAEVVWIVAGRNDSKFPNFFNSQLPRFAGFGSRYYGAYGYRLRKHFGFDQLNRAFATLQSNQNSRQVVLQIWDGRCDLPRSKGTPNSPDIPCNIAAMLKIRDNRLHWSQILRSNDLFRGVPYNIIQFTTLQEVLAGWLQVNLGTYSHFCDSLHVYEDTLGAVLTPPPRPEPARNADSLALPKKQSETCFAELASIGDRVIDSKTKASQLVSLADCRNLPPAFRNIAIILCAEGARRRRQTQCVHEILSMCTNPALTQAYAAWTDAMALAHPKPAHELSS